LVLPKGIEWLLPLRLKISRLISYYFKIWNLTRHHVLLKQYSKLKQWKSIEKKNRKLSAGSDAFICLNGDLQIMGIAGLRWFIKSLDAFFCLNGDLQIMEIAGLFGYVFSFCQFLNSVNSDANSFQINISPIFVTIVE